MTFFYRKKTTSSTSQSALSNFVFFSLYRHLISSLAVLYNIRLHLWERRCPAHFNTLLFFTGRTHISFPFLLSIFDQYEREGRKLPPANFLISSEDGWQLSTDENWMPFWNTPFEVVDHNREQRNWWLYLAAAVFDQTFENWLTDCVLYGKGEKGEKNGKNY